MQAQRHGRQIAPILLVLCGFACHSRPTDHADALVAPPSRQHPLPAVAVPQAISATAALRPDPLEDLELPADDPLPGGEFGGVQATRSHSLGSAQDGALQDGVAVREDSALRLYAPTKQRGFYYGTEELVGLLQRSAQAVADEFPGSVLQVANLSRQGGGDIAPSVSHNSGRDSDVIFYSFDRLRGQPASNGFVHYDGDGIADGPPSVQGRVEFDTPRNWTLVRHLLSDPRVVVQWIFVSVALRNRLLDYALRQGEPESLRQRAMRILVQPRNSSPHADHFHVRVACPQGDRPDCIDGYENTVGARAAQVDALLEMYDHGSPGEQRYARELLSLPEDGQQVDLPPLQGDD